MFSTANGSSSDQVIRFMFRRSRANTHERNVIGGLDDGIGGPKVGVGDDSTNRAPAPIF